MKRTKVGGAAAGLLSPLLVAFAPSGPPHASADPAPYPPTTKLSMPRFSDIEADPGRDRAFISGGANVDAIEIVSTEGQIVDTVPIRHAEDMLLSPDGATLYVAVNREPASVAAIDLDTLEVSTVALIEGDEESGPLIPHKLVWAADMIWVMADHDGYRAELVAVDPGTGSTHSFELPDTFEAIASTSARPHTILTAGWGDVYRYRVTGGDSPTLDLVASKREATEDTDQLALTPDGRRVVTYGGSGALVSVLRLRDLARVDSYPSGWSPTGVAVRGDGQVAVSYKQGVSIFAAGHTSFAALHKTPPYYSTDGEVLTSYNGLAWGEDELYSVLNGPYDGSVRVAVLPDDAPSRNPVLDGMQAPPYEGVTMFEQIVMVPGTDRGFLTPGATGNGVFVINGAGQVTRVLEHLPGAAGMALSRDNRILYVALSGAEAIAKIKTRTLRVSKIPTGSDSYPMSLALTGNRLWFTGQGQGVLNALDLRTGRTHTNVGEAAGTNLRTSPMRPNLLWMSSSDWQSGGLALYRITRRGRAEANLLRMIAAGPSAIDQSLTPDGLHLLPATPVTEFHPVLGARSLELAGWAETQYNPAAVAVRADGLFAAGVADMDLSFLNPSFRWAVRLFETPLGPQTGTRGLYLPHKDWVAPRGLAFGDRDLYAVYQNGDVHVQVKPMPPVRPVTLTADSSAYQRRDEAHLVAHLTRGAPHDAVVDVYRTTERGRVLVRSGRPDGFGNLHAHVTFRRPVRYVAVARLEGNVWRSAIMLRKQKD